MIRGRPGPRAICPVIVGRDAELRLLGQLFAGVAQGRGTTVVVCGEAGVGKSRLAREAVAAAGKLSMTTLVGRCVQHGLSPYRPFTEALFPVARGRPLPDTPELRPFRHALGTIVPDWRFPEGVEESSVVIGEGVLRLMRHLADGAGTLLVVEDAQWADPDTLAVVEYVADNVATEPTVVLMTVRSEEPGPASELVARLEVRGAARVVPLNRLDSSDVAAMAIACGGQGLAADVLDAVARRSEGLPLLVEELLSVPVSGISDAVPDSFADAVARRLGTLPAESVLVVQCAAVLGRRFDWRLLPGVTALDEARVWRGLEDGVAVQLLAADDAGAFRFRHALTRDAVVRSLLPPTRVSLARRAAQAVAEGGDDDDRSALAADLWVAAGDHSAAGSHLLAAGRRATARGALVTAERLLERARVLSTADAHLQTEVDEALAEALALAAKLQRALEVGGDALRSLGASPAAAARRARLHLALARAADAATRWHLANEHLNDAGSLARETSDEALLVRVDALAAHVAMGELRHHDAEVLARRAVEEAARLHLPDVECEALEVLGRRERIRDLRRAAELFEREYDVATRHGLALWSIRALHELGTIDMFETSSPGRLLQASELAYEAGALALAATVDLQLLGLHGFLFQVDEAVEVGNRAVDVARTLGLSEVHAAALLQLGFAHAIAGHGEAVEEAVGAGLRVAGDHPEALALAWGHARATFSLLSEDRARALEQLDIAMGWARNVPGVTGAFPVLWALLRVLEGAGEEVIAELADFQISTIPMNGAIVAMAEAVLAGRAGDCERAMTEFEAATSLLEAKDMDGICHLVRRLVAEAALADGWGDPVAWLTEAMVYFDGSGHDRLAAACRDLLRRAGRRVPRAADPALPGPLKAAGVTNREADVLRLVGDRLSNREIAERLYLSPRTVEKHVERLLQKTAVATRVELGRLAREVFTALPSA